jgi:hypothetical protein
LTYATKEGDQFEAVPVERIFPETSDKPYSVDLNALSGWPDLSPSDYRYQAWFDGAVSEYLNTHPGVRLYARLMNRPGGSGPQHGVLPAPPPGYIYSTLKYFFHYAFFQNYIPERVGYHLQTRRSGSFNISSDLAVKIMDDFYKGDSNNLYNVPHELDNIKFLSWFLKEFDATEIQISNVLSAIAVNNPGDFGFSSLSPSDASKFIFVADKVLKKEMLTTDEKEFYNRYVYLFSGTAVPVSDEEKQILESHQEGAASEQSVIDEKDSQIKKYIMYGLGGLALLLIFKSKKNG